MKRNGVLINIFNIYFKILNYIIKKMIYNKMLDFLRKCLEIC